MKIKYLLLVLVIALVSCDKDDEETNPDGPAFLKIGNVWTYDLKSTSQGISMSGDFSYDIVSGVEDGSYSVKETTIFQGFPAESQYVTWWWDNVFNLGRDMRYVSVGDSWSEPLDGVDYYTTVQEGGLEITVPAGTFTCMKLSQTQSDDPSRVGYYYYNEDSGVVMMEISYEEDIQGQTHTIEQTMKLKSTNF